MKVQKILLPIIIAIAVLAFFSIFVVKEVNQAIVLQFGDPKKIILKPGLNFKIPFIQNVVFLDNRILNPKFSASIFTPSWIKAICLVLSSDKSVCNSCWPKTFLILELIIDANLYLATLSFPTEI